MTLDVFRWLVVRTDLSGAALSMIVKEGISLIGGLCEWLTKKAPVVMPATDPIVNERRNWSSLGTSMPL